MLNKKFVLLGFAVFLLVITLANISAFCTAQGGIYNATGTLTNATPIYVVCVNSSGNVTYVVPGSSNSYGYPFGGGPATTCPNVCSGGMYVNATNSTLGAFGEVFNTSCTANICYSNIYMLGAPGPILTIVTPTSDYAYTNGTTNYDATCVAGDGSVDEVIFISNHSGVETNYSYLNAEVTNPSGDTYRYSMPSLAAGTTLIYNWFCNQTTGGISDTDGPQAITVTQSTSNCDVFFNESTGLTYPASFRVYTNCDSDYVLYRNGTVIDNGSEQALGAGTYNFTVIRNDTQNYTNFYDNKTFVIQQATPTLNYYLNDFTDNASITYPETLNASASVGIGTLTIYRNSSDVTGENNIAMNLSAGYYKYEFNVTGNENYSGVSQTLYANVNKFVTNLDIVITPENVVQYPTFTSATATGCPPAIACSFYRNDTGMITDPDNVTLGAGAYNYTVNTSGNENYTSDSYSEILEVSQNGSSCQVLFNESTGLTYPASFIVWHNCDTSATLYRNSSSIFNDSEQTLAAGTYNFSVVRTDSQNYTNYYDEKEFEIQQAIGEVYCYLNASRYNLTIEINEYADLNATINVPATGDVLLYSNNTLINQGANTIFNVTQFTSYGYFNVTAFYVGNENYTGDFETWYVIVNDSTPPQFTLISNISVYHNESVYSDIDATDASPICFYVNDTVNFNINCAGILQNSTVLSIGMHWLNITVNDSFGNKNSSVIYVNVTEYPDNYPPYFTTTPENASINYGQSLNVDFDAVDDEGNFDSFSVNDTRFSINSTGGLVNSSSLAVGVYVMNVSINDTHGNYNWTLYQVDVSASASSCDVLFNETSPLSYPYSFEVYSNCDSAFVLYRNGSVVGNNSEQALGAGTYNFTVIRTDNANYTNSYKEEDFVIDKAIPSLSYYLNEVFDNATVDYPNTINASAFVTGGSVGIFRNSSNVTLENNADVSLGVGYYEYEFNSTGNENYTNLGSRFLYATINQGTGDILLYLNNSGTNITTDNGTYINLSAVLNTGSGSIKLYNNDTLINQGTGVIYNYIFFDAIGIYNISAIYDGNDNYSADIKTLYVNVTLIPDTSAPVFTDIANISVYDNESVYYDINATDQTGISCFTVNDTNNFTIDCDGVLQNATALSLGVYWLNITVNDTLGYENSIEIYVNVTEYPTAVCGNGIIEGTEECDLTNLSGQTCVTKGFRSGTLTCSVTCTFDTSGCSSGGGGGGGVTPPEEELPPFSVVPDSFVIDVVQGEENAFTFTVTNNLDAPLQITVDYGSLADFISLNPNDIIFTLQAGESNNIDVDIYADFDTIPDSYIGKIIVRGAGERKDVDTVINVKQRPEEALFDIMTNMITRRVRPGTEAVADIELINLGTSENVPVTLYYSIMDFENNTVVNGQEDLNVIDTLIVRRSLLLPANEVDLNYVFYSRVVYPGGSATSADTFTTSEIGSWILFVIAVTLVLASMVIIIILYRRNTFEVVPV